ncbi:type 2 isopentenyl-diphosphate Delta-isomerase [Lentilactobacillus sp. SPB1-3]|uniref:Type 2 isopentenyl-diphosphate Delta-isomerase n=1 Tax=Lentilactobacillus terminaliae TaxID=3003483 RepID=A0ACD5DC80_9LACO|nr:type 2 isopentenyl-diphosphate Delta-isomerase [Lentilactobacillus sp. SPB1-3]MCZ0977229.1 type 2 isopentenyl-diphosphate Delta-isomerase [Lentilactobacillus sp. SPB1-3]
MVSQQSHRKDEHLSLAEHFYSDNTNNFSGVRLIPTSLPKYGIKDIDISTKLEQINFKVPFYINAITGGSEQSQKINARIANIAKQTGLAMSVGSQSIAINDPDQVPSFTVVRDINPEGIVMANIGANHNAADAQKAVDMLHADILEVHINPTQELVMPEGDREFHFIENIKDMIVNVSVPVIVKEVGFGMSQQTMTELANLGVKTVDVSGSGGTNFAKIENFRRPNKDMDYLSAWGLSTIESLIEAAPINLEMNVIASGGVKTPLDIAKCFALGADLVGMSGQVLHLLLSNHDDQDVIDQINDWIYGLKAIMVLTNSKTISDLKKADKIFDSELLNFQNQRNSGLY